MEGKEITALIHNHQVEKWHVSLEELHKRAKENTPKLCPSTICRLDRHLLGLEEEDDLADNGFPILYILSNKNIVNGATCMLYDAVIKNFADKLNSDLIILPSSIHEVLLLKDDDSVKLEMLREMVRSMNMDSVPAEDILSDDPYFYSREEERIRVA